MFRDYNSKALDLFLFQTVFGVSAMALEPTPDGMAEGSHSTPCCQYSVLKKFYRALVGGKLPPSGIFVNRIFSDDENDDECVFVVFAQLCAQEDFRCPALSLSPPLYSFGDKVSH